MKLAKDIELENFKNDRVKLESPIFDKVNFHDIEAFKDMNHNWGKKLKQKEHLRVNSLLIEMIESLIKIVRLQLFLPEKS